MSDNTENLQIIMTYVDTVETAEEIANALVKTKLAACVNIIPAAKSIYIWQDKLHSEGEQLMLIKSLGTKLRMLKTKLNELHPYDTPLVCLLSAKECNEKYLTWAKTVTAGSETIRA